MIFVKQSTAVDVVIGPFVDDTDGKTAETGLTVSQGDCQLSKNAGAVAQKNDATAASHLGGGHYKVPLNTTDTNTLGRLRLYVNESGALPVWLDMMVMPANVWDSLFSSDLLQVDLTQIGGAAVSTSTAQLGVNAVQAGGTAWGSGAVTAASIASGAITNAKFASGAIDATAVATGAITSAKFAAGAIDATAIADNAIDAGAIATGAITSAKLASGAITAAALATDAVDEIVDAVWDEDMVGHTTAGTTGELLELGTVDWTAEIADAVWDELLAGHTTTGSAGEGLTDAAAGGGGGSGDVTSIDGSTTAADNLRKWFDGTGYSGPNNSIGEVGEVLQTVTADIVKLGGSATDLQLFVYLLTGIVHSVVAAGTNTTTVVTTALPSSVSNFYVGKTFVAISGANAKQGGKLVTAYDGATKRLTIEALTAPMTALDQFYLVG